MPRGLLQFNPDSPASGVAPGLILACAGGGYTYATLGTGGLARDTT
jgi:hypothetical protein